MTQSQNLTDKGNYSTQEILTLLELNDQELDSTQVTNPERITSETLTNEVNQIDEDPSQTQKKKEKKFSKNPYAKFGLITLAVGSVAIFLGLLFAQGNSIYSSFSNSSTTADASSSGGEAQPENSDQSDSMEQRNAKLSGELALADQDQQMKAIREKLDNGQETPSVTIDKGETVSSPKPVVQKAPVPPTPVVSPPQTVQPRSPRPVSTYTPTPPPSPRPSSPQPQRDPIEQWQQLAQLGSYGGGQQVNQVVAAQSDDPKLSPDNNIPERQGLSQATLVSQSTAGFLQLGQQAKAVLATPIAVPIDTRNLNSATNEFIFTVTLSEPLQTPLGEVVIKEGATVVFAVPSVQNGIVNSQAVAVINEGREYPVPPDALQIRLSNGSPLIAQLKDNYSSEVVKRDGATFVMGALSQAGELANRATSTSTFSGVGGISSSSTYNQPNYVGAILEGGFSPLAEQWQQRNQQAISEVQNLSRLWWVEAGVDAQVFVTRSFQLGQGGIDAKTPQ